MAIQITVAMSFIKFAVDQDTMRITYGDFAMLRHSRALSRAADRAAVLMIGTVCVRAPWLDRPLVA